MFTSTVFMNAMGESKLSQGYMIKRIRSISKQKNAPYRYFVYLCQTIGKNDAHGKDSLYTLPGEQYGGGEECGEGSGNALLAVA